MKFLKNYDNPKNIRFQSFEFALLEASRRNHKTLVKKFGLAKFLSYITSVIKLNTNNN